MPTPAPPRPVFIVGCPRSGTTLLSALLHAHPSFAVPPETRFLIRLYEQRHTFGDLNDPQNRRALARAMTARRTMFRDLRLDRPTVVRAVVNAPPTLGSAFAALWEQFARDRGKSRWGEKRPAYWRDLPVIMRLFPDAQVIHLVRDPRSCVASLSKVPWWHRSTAYSAALWALADAALRESSRKLSRDSYFRLRYEDLVADPRTWLTELCRFLGEPFAEEMLDQVHAAADIVPARKTWHANVGQAPDAARIEGWRNVLTEREVGLIQLVTRRQMRTHGYSPEPVRRPTVRDVIEFAYVYVTRRAALTNRRLRDAWLRLRHPMPLAAVRRPVPARRRGTESR